MRYLTYQTMGAMIVQFVTMPDATPEEFVCSLRANQRDSILPILELFTEGLLADRQMLDAHLQFLSEPPDGLVHPAPTHPPAEHTRRPRVPQTKEPQ